MSWDQEKINRHKVHELLYENTNARVLFPKSELNLGTFDIALGNNEYETNT